MPEGNKKSRTLRRVTVKLPGGRVKKDYRQRAVGKAHCSNCKTELAGTVRARASQLNKIPKTQRRPERPFGGVLCSPCTRKEITKRIRGKA